MQKDPKHSRTDDYNNTLTFDFPSIKIGIAEHDNGPTGVTVFYFPEGALAVVDVRGGSPGAVNTPALSGGSNQKNLTALVFAGGSDYGLSAQGGVADAIKSETHQDHVMDYGRAIAGAVIYDLGARRYKYNTHEEYYNLGKQAIQSVESGKFPLGAYGAGRLAVQGSFFGDCQPSGQGAAVTEVMVNGKKVKIGVFTVVNSIGSIVDKQNNVVRPNHPDEEKINIHDRLSEFEKNYIPASIINTRKNTTLTLVVTNLFLNNYELNRLAIQVHASMARVIQPFNTFEDGDILYAVSTQEVNSGKNKIDDIPIIGTVASRLAWDAVLSSVPKTSDLIARSAIEPINLEANSVSCYVGEYKLSEITTAQITLNGNKLYLSTSGELGENNFGQSSYYLDHEAKTALIPVDLDEFVYDAAPDLDVKEEERTYYRCKFSFFNSGSNQFDQLTLNPGKRAQIANRIQTATLTCS